MIPGHVCELLLICVDLSEVGVNKSCLLKKTLPKILLKRLYQDSPESCLLRKTLPKSTVISCDSRSHVRTFVDMCGFKGNLVCLKRLCQNTLGKTLLKLSRIMSG